MSNLPANQKSSLPSTALTRSSQLWADLDHVVFATGRSHFEVRDVDLRACREVDALLDTLGTGTDPKDALAAAKQIIGCYRARDFADVDTFVTVLVALLAQHPRSIVWMAADPFHGIPRKYKFAPAIAEVADELEKIETRIRLASQGARRALALARPKAV